MIIGIRSAETAERIGELNAVQLCRGKLLGSYVSKEQPDVIDDPTKKAAFTAYPSRLITVNRYKEPGQRGKPAFPQKRNRAALPEFITKKPIFVILCLHCQLFCDIIYVV